MFDTVQLLKALSDESRLRILMSLRGGELCVCQITELLGLAPSTVSKHISILNRAGFIQGRKQGRWTFCQLSDYPSGSFLEQLAAQVIKALERDAAILQDNLKLKEIKEKGEVPKC